MEANAGESARTTPSSGAPGAGKKQFAVFTIVEIDRERALWRRVGNAYVNRDGSFNLYLDALPVNGRLHMREDEKPPHHERP